MAGRIFAMRFLLTLVALVGLAVSWMALRVHYTTEMQPCDINEKWDCGIVNHSPYSVLGGVPGLAAVPGVKDVPVAVVGMAGYVFLALAAFGRKRKIFVVACLLGLGFSLWLTHIEKDVLETYCVYCVTSLGLIAIETLLGLGWAIKGRG